jgi:hypothetical protein
MAIGSQKIKPYRKKPSWCLANFTLPLLVTQELEPYQINTLHVMMQALLPEIVYKCFFNPLFPPLLGEFKIVGYPRTPSPS